MTVQQYKELQLLIARELNVHEVRYAIATTEKGPLSICTYTGLGFNDKPDEIYIRLGGKKINNPKLLEKLIKQAGSSTVKNATLIKSRHRGST